ncbi:MAG: immunoglobulin domain-containing protein, partial [Verrucomicrobiota bacterium]
FAVTATSPPPETNQRFLDGVAIPSATSATYNIASASANDEGSYTVEITNSYATITSSPASLTLIPAPTEIAPGVSPVPAFNSTIYALENTPDGGVFVGGQFTNYNGFSTHDYLVKINPDGTHDSSFTPPAFNNSVRDLALQDDGKLLVVGNFSSITGSSARRLIRLNTDGSIDTTFASAIADGANGDIYAVEIEPDGNILLAGAFSSFANTSLSSGSHDLIRLAPDGSVLANTTNDLSVRIQDLQLLPNGQFLAAYDTSSSSAIKVRRYNSDLTPDFSFTYSSGRTEVEQIALANDGDYLFAGPNNLLKINPDATTDTTFFTHNARDVEVQLNGKILAGSSNSPRLFRFLPDTTADPIFTLATPPNGEVNRLAIREDGKTWVAGAFSTFNGLSHSRLVLINGDAIPLAITSQPDSLVLDPTEAATFSISATGTSAISFQWFKDGTPLSDSANISGSNTDTLTITSVSESNEGDYTCTVTNDSGSETSTPANLLVRGAPEYTSQPSDLTQLAGGSLTLTAEVIGASPLTYQWLLNNQPLADGGNISGATTNSLTISPAGTGDSGTYTLVATNGLGSTNSNDITVTINPNPAAIADGYTPPTIDGAVEDILPLPGGGVLIAGSFSSVTDGTTTSNSNLAVVEEGGTVRNLPNLSAGAVVRTLHRQADGKILLGGDFAQVNGVNQSRLARLNADFTLDTSFVHDGPAFGFGSIYDLVTDSSGDIYVGGTHFGWGTTGAYAYLTKLMPDGTHDLSFAPTMSSWVYSLAMAADDDLYAGGLFTNVDGDTNTTTDTYLVRLNPDGTVDFGFAADHSGTFSARNIYLDSQNRLYANSAFNNTFRRYLPDGSVDTSFTNTFNSRVLAYAEDSNGLPLFGGLFTTVDSSPSSRLARLDATFTLDPAFEVGSGFDNQVNVITPSGNNLWIGGTFLNYNGVSSPYLAKLQGDQESDPIEAYYDSFGIPVNERDDNANNDGDNFPLLFEYLYEFDPTLPDSWSFPLIAGNFGTSGADINALEPTANLDPNKTYRGVRYRLPKDMKGLTYEVEATRDLTFVLDGSLTVNEFGSPIDDGDYWIRSFYFTPDLTQIPALFYRLQISRPD